MTDDQTKKYDLSEIMLTAGTGIITSMKIKPVIHLSNGQGKTAVIDYGGEVVRFYGDLPVDEAAQSFFNAVGHLLKK